MKYELIIPHLCTPILDQSLGLCQEMIRENTPQHVDLQVTVDPDAETDPYEKWNRVSYQSKADILVFINNDMLMMPGWTWMLSAFSILPENAVVTGHLVESGALKVNERNVQKDFGMHPDEFQRKECEAFCLAESAKVAPVEFGSTGWLMPVAFRREFFCRIGGYDTGTAKFLGRGKFPDPLDLVFFDKLQRVGAQFVRVNSWAYHFQRLSLR
jgi:hypothetical protein